jgi:cephalosporin-C deacetylase-like acetyl esterase
MGPPDLDSFWAATIKESAQTAPEPLLKEASEQSGQEFVTYQTILHSFQGKRLRGWYSVPKDPPPWGKFPAVLAVPGYQGNKDIPTHLVRAGFAVLTLFPRGQGESRQEWELEHSTKLTYNITDKHQYYYRGGYMDCLRGLDFLSSRDEVDASRLGMWSRSQGGGFTLATASLDPRLRVAVAEEPFLCNFPVSVDVATPPYRELGDFISQHPEQRQAVLDTLAYFDPLNLVENIRCPTLVNIGMKDQTCPYRTIMPVFEKITAPKALHVYPDLAHSPCTDFNAHALEWLRRYLGG